jgi:hypothetical protein
MAETYPIKADQGQSRHSESREQARQIGKPGAFTEEIQSNPSESNQKARGDEYEVASILWLYIF